MPDMGVRSGPGCSPHPALITQLGRLQSPTNSAILLGASTLIVMSCNAAGEQGLPSPKGMQACQSKQIRNGCKGCTIP